MKKLYKQTNRETTTKQPLGVEPGSSKSKDFPAVLIIQ